MKPNILDRNWKYVPASQTDIRRTFARIRRDLAKQQAKPEEAKVFSFKSDDGRKIATVVKIKEPR